MQDDAGAQPWDPKNIAVSTVLHSTQVQDVSLIFQSAIATSIAGMCTAAGYKAEEALGTVLMTLVIATFVVGVLIVAVGAHMHNSIRTVVPSAV